MQTKMLLDQRSQGMPRIFSENSIPISLQSNPLSPNNQHLSSEKGLVTRNFNGQVTSKVFEQDNLRRFLMDASPASKNYSLRQSFNKNLQLLTGNSIGVAGGSYLPAVQSPNSCQKEAFVWREGTQLARSMPRQSKFGTTGSKTSGQKIRTRKMLIASQIRPSRHMLNSQDLHSTKPTISMIMSNRQSPESHTREFYQNQF